MLADQAVWDRYENQIISFIEVDPVLPGIDLSFLHGSLITHDTGRLLKKLLLESEFCTECQVSVEQTDKGLVIKLAVMPVERLAKVSVRRQVLGQSRVKACYGLRSGDAWSVERHEKGLNALVQYYRALGYLRVVIKDRVVRVNSSRKIYIELAVDPGVCFSVGEVLVNGIQSDVTEIQLSELRDHLIKQLTHRFRTHVFTQHYLEDAQRIIADELQKFGYSNVPVSLAYQLHEDRARADLVVTIDLSCAVSIVIEGIDDPVVHQDLLSYSHNLPEWSLDRILVQHVFAKRLKELGFLNAQIQIKPGVRIWQYTITLGDRVSPKKIEPPILPEPMTNQAVSSATIPDTPKGRPATYLQLDAPDITAAHFFRSCQSVVARAGNIDLLRTQLAATGAFHDIQLQTIPITAVGDRQILLLRLRNGDPFELRARLGVAGVSHTTGLLAAATYKAGFSLAMRNCTGSADYVSFNFDITRYYTKFDGTYTLPLFGKRIAALQAKCFNYHYRQPIFWTAQDALFSASRSGFFIGVNSSTGTQPLSALTGFNRIRLFDLSPERAIAIDFRPSLINVPLSYFPLEFQIGALVPDEQARMSSFGWNLSARLMLPVSSQAEPFVRCMAEQTIYQPLSHSFLFALRTSAGLIGSDSLGVLPPSERFYLGGPNSIRSFAPDTAPPVVCLPNDPAGCLPVGGNAFIFGNFELRYQFDRFIQLVAFQDLGFMKADQRHSPLLTATGLGIRYNTPIGSLRLDLGIKPKLLYPTDKRAVWFFTLGNAF